MMGNLWCVFATFLAVSGCQFLHKLQINDFIDVTRYTGIGILYYDARYRSDYISMTFDLDL